MAKGVKVARVRLAFRARQRPARAVGVPMLEHKRYSPTTNGGSNFTTAGFVGALTSPIAQGDAINNRSGDQITVKTLRIRFNAFSLVAATSSAYRVIVFRDQMQQGALPAVTDVLQNADYLSPYNFANLQQKRFVVLFDEVKAVVGATNFQEVQTDKTYAQNVKVHYLDGTGNVSGGGKNQYFILVIASAANGSFVYRPEVVYTDA